MPGIETRAPERTETSSGCALSPKRRPTAFSIRARAASTWAFRSSGYLPVVVVERGADLGRDGEARRDRQADRGHFGQVGALAAEQVLHIRPAFVVTGAEAVNPLGHGGPLLAFDTGKIGDLIHDGPDLVEQTQTIAAQIRLRGVHRHLFEERIQRRAQTVPSVLIAGP